MSDAPQSPARGRRRLFALLPLLLFLIVAGFLYVGLGLKPKDIPSSLIGKPAPEFDMPGLPGRGPGLKTADLKGEVALVNVFASWCVSCRVEHPLLMEVAKQKLLPLYGLNYKDEPEAALGWLKGFGDPYDRVGVDPKGRVAIDFGVYGVPETFLIDRAGNIVCKHLGPIMPADWDDKLLPAIQALKAGNKAVC